MTAPMMILDRGRTFVVRGHASEILREAGITPFYTGVSRGFVVDGHRLGDLCAWLDARGLPYRIRKGDSQ